jgi:hypothetical protein
MSSQFSYELDERHIKILMSTAEINKTDELWDKFVKTESSKIKNYGGLNAKIPTINIGVNRSVIVPVLFILLIGSLSAMLFNFVDSKKKEEIINEVPYVAPVIKPVVQEIKKTQSIKPVLKTPIITNTLAIIDSVANKIDTISKSENSNAKEIKNETRPKSEDKILTKEIFIEQVKEVKIIPKKKKLKRVELPIITTAPDLNEGSKEPELELK